ncbi:methionine biosynthesis protein MetW [Patescibacteria group bacterium]|nr:methionine biosynthesis protein MetW [Patescibacteria group bacterium]MCG2694871.1 methionine biosynthesis protein MetW [Candidatus Parcubacteria bacterium]
MSVKNFENKHWKESNQEVVFRHKTALEMISRGKVLDVGSGDGLFMEMLKQKDIFSKGVDFSEEGVKKCKEKNLTVSLCDFSTERLPFSDNEFDYVVALDVLEHLYFPEILLKDMMRVSGIYIIIGVPNFSSLPARAQMFFGDVPENNNPKRGHIFWFNYKILQKMLKNNNLQQIDMVCNTFWEDKIIFGRLMKSLVKIFPSLFALSFVIKIKK